MKTKHNDQYKAKLTAARKQAFAVLQDKGKINPGARIESIGTLTMAGLLGITYTNGKPLVESSGGPALIHWSNTGFPTYTPNLHAPSKKQKKWSDASLMRTAIAETMANRRRQFYEKL